MLLPLICVLQERKEEETARLAPPSPEDMVVVDVRSDLII